MTLLLSDLVGSSETVSATGRGSSESTWNTRPRPRETKLPKRSFWGRQSQIYVASYF